MCIDPGKLGTPGRFDLRFCRMLSINDHKIRDHLHAFYTVLAFSVF